MPPARINPWKWQDRYGYSQAIEVSGASRMLFCAGQIALDADGKVKCAGDMRGQIEAAMNRQPRVYRALRRDRVASRRRGLPAVVHSLGRQTISISRIAHRNRSHCG